MTPDEINEAKQSARKALEPAAHPGQTTEVPVTVGGSYLGGDINVPVHVQRAKEPGPWVFITAAVHGDEINGTGAIREIITSDNFQLKRGALVALPVVNIQGFERHSRYMPDRRDLNRSFPGSPDGSVAARLAHAVFHQIVLACDLGIDLHTAAIRRTNFPNVRADMKTPAVTEWSIADWARAFGAELIVHGSGPEGSLRRAACDAGVPTFILEAGEPWKLQGPVVEYAVRGIKNCLAHLGMIDSVRIEPPYKLEADSTHWVRAEAGGFLDFHVSPGQVVEQGEALATNTTLTGQHQRTIEAPRPGIILGMTTFPSVSPGDPVCHIATTKGTDGKLRRIERVIDKLPEDSLHERAREGLAAGLYLTEAEEDE